MPFQTEGIVLKNRGIKSPYFILWLHCPPIANRVKPGQFVMLQVSNDGIPLLRRPFSVYKSYPADHPDERKRGDLTIVYKTVGKGTRKMTALKKGQKVGLIGPLGNGFTLPPLPSSEKRILIGGGMGIVSLFSLTERLGGRNLTVLIGGRTQSDVLCVDDFKKSKSRVLTATEDGSMGMRGTVVDLFFSQRKRFKKNEKYSIYACGPVAMLRALARAVPFKNVACQVSLEARMGCGFGACWGCVVRTNHPKTPYQRVCKDGPVFALKDIVWERE